MVDPTIPLPLQALPPEARQAAYQQLLGQADSRYDRGDSSQTMADILNRVDMDRAGRVAGMWSNRSGQYGTGAESMLGGVGAATAATRAGWVQPPPVAPVVPVTSAVAKRRGGGGSKPVSRKTDLHLKQPTWMEAYAKSLLQTPTYGSGGSALRMHYR
jgi:hypothetical protein